MDSFVFPFYTDYRALLYPCAIRETVGFTRVRKYDQLMNFLVVYSLRSRIVSLRRVRVVRFE